MLNLPARCHPEPFRGRAMNLMAPQPPKRRVANAGRLACAAGRLTARPLSYYY